MFDFFKGKKKIAEEGEKLNDKIPEATFMKEAEIPSKESFLGQLKRQLQKTRQNFSSQITHLFLGKKTIDSGLLESLEELLLSADIGIKATQSILDNLTQKLKRNQLNSPEDVMQSLRQHLVDILTPCEKNLYIPDQEQPYVILMIGINGSGKTTSIGKLAYQLQTQGKRVILAAGDTFRAAAIEQLGVWAERNNIPVIAQHSGADSASVIFDAYQAANTRGYDVLIADTAGRLHTQSNLMEELKKVSRVLKKLDPKIPQEVFLVLDASIGQNALIQAQKFHEAMDVTGLILTKLDGTARGGVIFNIAKTLNLPILFIGVGEGIEDLKPFSAVEFVDALFEDHQ